MIAPDRESADRTPIRSSRTRAARNFVDFDEDLQVKDLDNAAQEGFDSIELLKRYTTVGMGPIAGQALERQCAAHSRGVRGELSLEATRVSRLRGRCFTRSRWNISRAAASPRYARTPVEQPPRTARRSVDAGGQLAPAGVLRACRRSLASLHRG